MVVADYSTSVRIFEALREKTENKTQYDAYVNELKPVREELGMPPKSVFPNSSHDRDFIKRGDVARCEMVDVIKTSRVGWINAVTLCYL
jgi:hypothetical protein